MLTALDIMTGKILVQLQLVPAELVRKVLRDLDTGVGDPARDIVNRLTDLGRLEPKEIELVRHRAALYDHVRAEASYLRLLERHANVPKPTVAKLIAELEHHAFRRRLGDVLLKQGKLKPEQDKFLSDNTRLQLDKDDKGIIDRYRREDFAGVAKPLMPGRQLVPEDFKISTLYRSRETRALVDKAELEALMAEAQGARTPEEVQASQERAAAAAARAGGDEPIVDDEESRTFRSKRRGDDVPADAAVGAKKDTRRAQKPPAVETDMERVRQMKRIADYTIVELLGAGGMGAVFLGQKAGAYEYVAIKVMLNGAASEAERGRFQREISLTRQLHHKNVIGILDAGVTEDGLSYLVVPALAGKELRSYLEKSPEGLEPAFACKVMDQVLQGLEAVHQGRIVHRDLKPENVFVLAGGEEAKLMDFGLAKLEDEAAKEVSQAGFRSMVGEIVGSPAYIAPESITNDPIDRRTDIYSLGVMFFEMLTGKKPIESENAQGFLTAHMISPPLTLAEARPERYWAPEVEELFAKMLGKTRDERPASCQAILEQLRGGLRDKIVKAGAPVPPTRSGEEPPPPLVAVEEKKEPKMGHRGLLGRLLGKG